ncbi:hypothetical protein FGB62_25g247 [Gracilaria domingensis]|nr:hypothetical protein FGB62_25g247 [Gracilaria domingensis]
MKGASAKQACAFVAPLPSHAPVRACAAQKSSKRSPRPTPRQKPRPKRAETQSDVKAYSIGDTLRDSPHLSSTLLTAMRDYFGDDGREVQDYMKRPRTENGEPMFRCVIVGSGRRELQLAKTLIDSGVICGLYYCPDHDVACDIEMNKYAQSTTVSAEERPKDVVRFAKWCVADAVFIGPDRQERISREDESVLAEAKITVFPHDVSAALADGSMDVKECLFPLAQGEEEVPADEQLLE